ncbi:MAG: IS3 family transposase [bacterium]
MKNKIKKYILYYNNKRIKEKLGYSSPTFWDQNNIQEVLF